MKKISLLAALGLVIASLMLTATQLSAGAQGTGPKKTPSPFLTGTPGTPVAPPQNPAPSNGVGGQNTPGAMATVQAVLHGKPTIYRGTIKNVNGTSVTITLADSTDVTLGITPDTQIRVPGPKAQGDTLVIGMRVVAKAFTDSNNNLVARSIIVIPGQPVRVHRVGTVTAYTAGASITIKATDGSSYTFTLTPSTRILPEGSAVTVGAHVTIIAPRDPSSLVWTATGIVVHAGP